MLQSSSTACEACEPGYFGIDPSRLSCALCLPGYVCVGATSSATPQDLDTDGGYICPRGMFLFLLKNSLTRSL